jgi:hypothetical protein
MGAEARWLAADWQWKVAMLAGLVLLGVAAYGGSLVLLGFRVKDFSQKGAA